MKQVLLALSLLALIGVAPRAAKAQVIKVDGSSTVFPITEAVAEEFQKANKGKVKVDRQASPAPAAVSKILPRRDLT